MKTAVGVQIGETKIKKPSWVRSVFGWFAWVYDRFDFWIIHRGRRLRPEVLERLEQAVKNTKQGKNISPKFSNVEDAIKWLDS